MKQKITLCAGLIAALAVSGHALAQPAPPPAYPGTVYPNAGLPPHEIAAMVRSTGLEPLGSPVRQGPIYAMRAVDPAGEEVRVIVDAQRGQIVKVIPLMAPRYAMPLMRPPYGRPPRPMAMVPEGYGPNPRAPMLPPGAEAPPPGAGPGLPHAAGAPNEPGPRDHAAAAAAAQTCVHRFIRCQARRGGRAAIGPAGPIKAGQRPRNHRRGHRAAESRDGAGRGV